RHDRARAREPESAPDTRRRHSHDDGRAQQPEPPGRRRGARASRRARLRDGDPAQRPALRGAEPRPPGAALRRPLEGRARLPARRRGDPAPTRERGRRGAMSTTPRRGLGRGLGALIPGAVTPPRPAPAPTLEPTAAPAPVEARSGPAEIAIDRIQPNPEQPRRVFDPAELERLAESIRQHGVLQPVVVRRAGDDGGYELVVGERRWRAARAAGLAAVPAVIADLAPSERLAVALVENVQRHDLNPIEPAHAFAALAEQGATQEEIGARVGF